MIPVEPQDEPATFDKNVRQPGLDWIRRERLNPNAPPPPKTELEPYWRAGLDALYDAYRGICAYLGIFFERQTGAASVDHFIAKSRTELRLAYEWSNYRLACLGSNQRKGKFDDVLDPFEVREGMFRLELVTGHILPNPHLAERDIQRVNATITRLDLDSEGCKKMRKQHYAEYLKYKFPAEFMEAKYPFLWAEILRQGTA